MVLHGVYENGVITILEKSLPRITARAEIIIDEKEPFSRDEPYLKVKKIIDSYHGEVISFVRDDLYAR